MANVHHSCVIAAGLRIYFGYRLSTTGASTSGQTSNAEFSYIVTNNVIWCELEAACTILAACMPFYAPIFRRRCHHDDDRRRYTRDHDHNYNTNHHQSHSPQPSQRSCFSSLAALPFPSKLRLPSSQKDPIHPTHPSPPSLLSKLRARLSHWHVGAVQEIEIAAVSPHPPANTPNTTQHTHSSLSMSRCSSAKESGAERSGSIEIDAHPGVLLTPPASAHSHIRPALRTQRSGSSGGANRWNQQPVMAPGDSRDFLVKDEEDDDDDEMLDIGLFMRERPRERGTEREGYFGRVLLVEELRREREQGRKGDMV